MELRVLEYFLMIAREENITKAAAQLHISQPTLSRQLSALEDELGVKLFTRRKYSVYLTSEGMLFRRRAQEIVNLSTKAKQELSQGDEIVAGEVSIGCGEFRSVDELTKLIAEFRRIYPHVIFNLHSSYNTDIQMWMEQGTLDMGLLMEPVDISKYDFVRMQVKEEWGVLVRKDSDFAKRGEIKPGELIGIPVITLQDETVHNELANWSGDFAKQMNPGLTYNLLYNAAIACRNTGNPVLCIRLECEFKDLTFIPLQPQLELSTVLAWKEHQMNSKAVNAFIKFIKEYRMRMADHLI